MIVCECLAITFAFYFLNEVSCLEEMSQIGRRAATPLEIEVVTVADYSLFNKWYELLDQSLPEAKKIEIAKQNLTTWIGTMVHTANLVYKRLEAHGLFISIKIVDLLIMTTEADSPWTETTKFKVNDTYFIDPDVVHSHFNPKSIELQKTIPHDHAMLLTRYSLLFGKSGTHIYSGNALGAECKPNSQSIVEDSGQMATAETIAHELGHSLGCEHDGTNNTCKVGLGYCMERSYVKYNKNKWIFSSCSIDYIQEFVNRTNRLHKNCLAKVNDNHPKPALALASQKWVGEIYSVDEQCVIAQGKGSFMCRGVYKENFTEFCLKMWCYNSKDDLCYMQDGGDGTPCAAGSWCVSNNCVKDSRAPSSHDDNCPFGEAKEPTYNNLTCTQNAATRPNECLRQNFKHRCCDSCKTAQTTSVPVDDQCKEFFGPDSYLCRSGYQVSSYEIICEHLYCFDTSTNHSCVSIYAYDKTPCGHKKWCIDRKCVQDSNAPDVSDDCPVGDRYNDSSVSYSNMTCAEIRQHDNNWACYSNYTKRQCCKTCEDARTNVKGCEYGDKHKSCKALIASDSSSCYDGDNAEICCSSCSKYYTPSQKGCEYGDKHKSCKALIASDPSSCYDGNNAEICCSSCSNYYTPSQKGCEYGDKDKTCKTYIDSDPSHCYQSDTAAICCSSCSRYYTPSQNGCEYGDKDVTGCADLIKSRSDGYHCYGNNAKICCRSCGQYLNASNSGCEYGDKFHGCVRSKCSDYTDESRKNCCETCKPSVDIVG
ncbi:A disintegrin and metalloproteinase with thrombospondin motifs 20-like isoform X2 [Ruditapes philippinarum]|uniref:A disintegrin and metalloproteinase with thrombospondin motifs 20-like isoform X2 n=1 Tax=Ruditapes philippinarum TaxID=129788 RepID=UPI00295A8B68|nr:A disintegrin and metalloproteinase with thrombospondin motifs 20-like isoform X2 [Ruditapes philippinarum]